MRYAQVFLVIDVSNSTVSAREHHQIQSTTSRASFSIRMLSALTASTNHRRKQSILALEEITRVAIESVSPRQLVGGSVRVVRSECGAAVMSVGRREYTLNHNVKVVAFGKAVLGMVEAVETLLGDHIVGGVASVPVGGVSEYRESNSKIRVLEGGANNLPDLAALTAAREILALCRGANEGEVVVALISGGGSALLPYPIEGVTLQDKCLMIEVLAKAGASIQDLNTFRKFFSETKGGRLAEATYPAQMVALILSDVIGDSLDTIASGPTTPSTTSHNDITALLEKYNLTQVLPSSMQHILSQHKYIFSGGTLCVPIENGSYKHVQNIIVGSNSIATTAAAEKACSMGYTSRVWSHSVQGEARLVGEVYAIIAYSIAVHHEILTISELSKELCFVELIQNNPAMLREFESVLRDVDKGRPRNLCLISGGETTVTVTGSGKGGRNQELALAFSIKYDQLKRKRNFHTSQADNTSDCVLMCLATDGQDGPTDAAGAIGHCSLVSTAMEQGIDSEESLRENDSYTFFSRVEGGEYHLKTGLTGTNVMDIHCILFANH